MGIKSFTLFTVTLSLTASLFLGTGPALAEPKNTGSGAGGSQTAANQGTNSGLRTEPLPVPSSLNPSVDKLKKEPVIDAAALSGSLGVPKTEWKIVSLNHSLLARLAAISMEAKRLYKGLTFFDKVKLHKEVHGKTETMLFTVENLPAFVSGKVGSYDTFAFLKGNLDEKLKADKITPEEYHKRIDGIQSLAKLTKDERGALVALLDEEIKARGIENQPEKETP